MGRRESIRFLRLLSPSGHRFGASSAINENTQTLLLYAANPATSAVTLKRRKILKLCWFARSSVESSVNRRKCRKFEGQDKENTIIWCISLRQGKFN